MAECILLKAGSGADLDLVTAGAGDVLSPKVIVDKDGNPLTGTLALSGDAAVGNVLAGKTFYSNDAKTKRTGTMVNQGAKTAALNCGGSYAIPAGYHNGSGKVTANSLSSQTSATAAAGDILTGKTAFVNGNKLTGNIGSMGAQTITPSTAQQTISCSGKYMTGNIVVKAMAAKTKSGQYASSGSASFTDVWHSNNSVSLPKITITNLGFTPKAYGAARVGNGTYHTYSDR